jgi:hypothetical protein
MIYVKEKTILILIGIALIIISVLVFLYINFKLSAAILAIGCYTIYEAIGDNR